MLLQKRSGFTTLPSRFSGGKRCFQPDFFETELPGLPSKPTENCRKKLQISQSVSFGELERGDTFPLKIVINETPGSLMLNCLRNPMKDCRGEFLHARSPQRAKSMSPQRGIHSRGIGIPRNEVHDELILGRDVTNQVEKHTRPHSGSTVRRRHSLSHFPSYNAELCSLTQPLAESVQSGLESDLWASLPASMQRKDELGNFLGETSCAPGGWSKEPRERNLELELSMMQFELLSLKQKIQDLPVSNALTQALTPSNSANVHLVFEIASDSLPFLHQMQSSFAYLEKEKMWLEMARYEDRKQKGNLDDKIFHLETELAKPRSYLGGRDPGTEFLDSSQNAKEKKKDVEQKLISLQESSVVLQKCIKALEKERDEMAEKIKSAEEEKVALHQQVQQLTLELAGAQKKQEVFSDQTLALHSELVSVKTQVNLQEQEKVVMKEELESTRQMNQELSSEVAESCQRLGASLEKLHHLEAENNILNNRIQSLENERTQLLREIEGRPHERQMNGRSQQENVAALQESCECLRESQSVLQSEKDSLQTRCLELEAALQQKQEEMVNHLMQQQQQVSQYWRGRWEEVTATPNAKEEELEKTPLQNQTLSAKYTECCSEKQRLQQLVTSLEEEMAEKEQALRDLRQAKDMDRTELEVKISSLEQKVAEMEAAQGPSNPRPNQALQILKGQKNGSVPSKDSRSCGACSHCAAALLQLNQLIQNCAEKSSGKQEEEATLTYLYQVQDLLKGKVQDQNPVSIPGRRETQKPDAKVSKSPQEAQENLRQQQQLVTEQLKELFRQRKLLKEAGCKKQPGGPKTEGLVETPKLQEALAMPESIGLAKEGQPEALAAPGNGGEVQSLQQQLKEKTETINSMASEIQALQEKNENLMKAKMRFQQQIQEIRKLPKQWQEKSNMEPLDPKPATSLGQDLQSAQWSDSSALSPQSDDTAFFSHSQEDLHMAMQVQSHDYHPTVEDKQSVISSDNRAVCLPPSGSAGQEAPFPTLLLPSKAETAVPSIKLSFDTPLQDTQGHTDTVGALISPGGSALLSPRPFGPQRPWSPFKFKGSPEPLED